MLIGAKTHEKTTLTLMTSCFLKPNTLFSYKADQLID